MHKCSLWRIPRTGQRDVSYFCQNHCSGSFSSDVLAGLSRNKERTEKLIANTGSENHTGQSQPLQSAFFKA